MHRITRRVGVAIAACSVVAFMSLAVGTALAAPAQHASGSLTSGPFHIAFDATRAADAPADAATGDFVADPSLGGIPLFRLHGPVTCLDVRGNRAGLFYPIQDSSPSLFSMLGSGVFIYIQLDSAGKAQSIGFLPVPSSHTSTCAPSLALFPVTSGSATLSS